MEVDADSPVPAYEQIVQQISQSARDGTLAAGNSPTTIRQLTGDLELNQSTVAKVCKTLASQRLLVTVGRSGSLIRDEAARYIVHNCRQFRHYVVTYPSSTP